jgi:hypothetical protein
VKNDSNESCGCCARDNTTRDWDHVSGFCILHVFHIVRFEPFSATTRSSFGRLKAAVCTPLLPSPDRRFHSLRESATPPELRIAIARFDGQVVFELLQYWLNFASFADSPWSRTVT